jgi:hypothetical protein
MTGSLGSSGSGDRLDKAGTDISPFLSTTMMPKLRPITHKLIDKNNNITTNVAIFLKMDKSLASYLLIAL